MRTLLVAVLLSSSIASADPKLADCNVATKNLGRVLGWYKSPSGCKLKPGDAKYKLLSKKSDVVANLRCVDPGDAKVGTDFAKDQIVIFTPNFAKGQTGVDAFDDGKTLTIVKMFGTLCPKDKPPVAGPAAPRGFYLGAGPRKISEVSCTKVWRC